MNKFIILLSLLSMSSFAIAQDIVILVNTSNPIKTISKAQLRNFFLKKETMWGNGEKVVAVIPTTQNKGYSLFLNHVLRMDKPTYDRYLIEMKFKSGNAPAKEFEESFIPHVVSVTLGGLGFMSRGEWKASSEYKVKEIGVTE